MKVGWFRFCFGVLLLEVITVLLLSNNYVLANYKQVIEHIYHDDNCEYLDNIQLCKTDLMVKGLRI